MLRQNVGCLNTLNKLSPTRAINYYVTYSHILPAPSHPRVPSGSYQNIYDITTLHRGAHRELFKYQLCNQLQSGIFSMECYNFGYITR